MVSDKCRDIANEKLRNLKNHAFLFVASEYHIRLHTKRRRGTHLLLLSHYCIWRAPGNTCCRTLVSDHGRKLVLDNVIFSFVTLDATFHYWNFSLQADVDIQTVRLFVKNVPDFTTDRSKNDLGFLSWDLKVPIALKYKDRLWWKGSLQFIRYHSILPSNLGKSHASLQLEREAIVPLLDCGIRNCRQ